MLKKIVSVLIAAIATGAMIAFGMRLIESGTFFSIAVASALFAYYVLPRWK